MLKELKDIALPWTEAEYRADPALSYSILATFERGGFYSLPTLYDKKSSPSLTLGQIVDTLITGSEEEFNQLFAVMDYNITDSGVNVCKALASLYGEQYKEFKDIPEVLVSQVAQEVGFWKDPKWNSRRYKEVLNTGDVDIYYKVLTSNDKTIISSQMYADALAMVDALRTSEATKFYFAPDNPFDDSIRRYYQLKFKATLDGVDYRCMADLIVVNYEKKTIQMCDLKTSGKPEYMFPLSYIEWSYQLQNRLYARIVEDNIKRDDYFKDFKMLPYLFIVVNKETLNPLVWKFDHTFEYGDIEYGNVVMRDPFTIGKELDYYLKNNPTVPLGIDTINPNDGIEWIKQHFRVK